MLLCLDRHLLCPINEASESICFPIMIFDFFFFRTSDLSHFLLNLSVRIFVLRLPFTSNSVHNIPQYAPSLLYPWLTIYISVCRSLGYNDSTLSLSITPLSLFILYMFWPCVCAFIQYHDPLDGAYLTIYIYLLWRTYLLCCTIDQLSLACLPQYHFSILSHC